MKSHLNLIVVLFSLLSAGLSGCIGGGDEMEDGYTGPIDLIVYYETTSGMIETSFNNGQAGPATGVTIEFDYADTTSSVAPITKIILDPDDGSTPIEADPSDNAVISYTWLTHGIFDVKMSVEDEVGNTHSTTVDVRIDMHIVWTESNTNSATMSFDATPDCEDGLPLPDRITISSTVVNQAGIFGGSSDVEWELLNPEGTQIATNSGNIPNGNEETWDYTTRDLVSGDWGLNVEVTGGDDVNVENDVTIAYQEGLEGPTNPRPQ
ncbi:MAG: hypothetical protein VW862_02585 [Euryarchaeota archaeon]